MRTTDTRPWWWALLFGAGLASAALAGPTVGPKLALNPQAGVEPLNAYMFNHRISLTGTGYAVTWSDDRSGNEALYAAARLDPRRQHERLRRGGLPAGGRGAVGDLHA